MKYHVGNRWREEAEILNFLLAQIHYHFQFTFCLCKERMIRVGVHIPQSCLLRWVSVMCAKPGLDLGESPRSVLHGIANRPPPRFLCRSAEVAVSYSSSRQTCDTARMSWLFAERQEPAWCSSLETRLQVPDFMLGRDLTVR